MRLHPHDYIIIAEALKEFGGDTECFKHGIRVGMRIGQAFFNALPPELRNGLVNTSLDPFHSDDYVIVIRAVEYLREETNNDAHSEMPG